MDTIELSTYRTERTRAYLKLPQPCILRLTKFDGKTDNKLSTGLPIYELSGKARIWISTVVSGGVVFFWIMLGYTLPKECKHKNTPIISKRLLIAN
jgi:hypothetical protein